MKAILKANLSFLLPYLLLIVFGAILLAKNTKTDIHIVFNSFHTSFFDTFFFFITYLGDGLIAILSVIILLPIKYKYALIVGISNLFAALITQLLKQTIFFDSLRPKKFFEGIYDLYFVPGVENYSYFSFPSGHSTSAFALFFAFALLVKNKTLKLFFFIIALLVAYSRVYLSQHFFEDVYAGSIIGLFTTLIVYYFIQKRNIKWMEHSLVSSFKSK